MCFSGSLTIPKGSQITRRLKARQNNLKADLLSWVIRPSSLFPRMVEYESLNTFSAVERQAYGRDCYS
jgi:hypothetical protein